MPGIIGFTTGAFSQGESINIIKKMQKLITHSIFYKKDNLFIDNYVCATRSHINIIQKEPQPYHDTGVYVWLDGEFYNQDDLNRELIFPEKSDPAILLTLYIKNKDFSFLRNINGIFSAVIYDSKTQEIHLIIDRYGLRHLYWTVQNGSLIWGSEYKVMLSYPGFSPKIDPQSVANFFNIGYLLEDRTWFESVELLSPATVLTWNINDKTLKKHNYWSWNEIRPLNGKIDEEEIAEELGILFIDAVERRCRIDENVGLSLSGGLDSRANLAALPERGQVIHAITFGKRDSDDVSIAARVASIKGAEHHIFEINKDNWLDPRINNIWWTDGELNLLHMHGINFLNCYRSLFEVSINGFAGDLILGGSYLHNKDYFDTNIDTRKASLVMKCKEGGLNNIDLYSSDNKTDYYFLNNRVRRFTCGGIKQSRLAIDIRKPFYDNCLVEFIYSLPDSLRYKSYIYNKMLLKTFPKYFQTIPWQKSGVPISWSSSSTNFAQLYFKINYKFKEGFKRLGLNIKGSKPFTDYPNWIRREPAKSFIKKVLFNNSALYPEYINKKQVIPKLDEHFKGKNHADMLCRYLTFEIWLQQVFEGNYLPGKSDRNFEVI